MAKQKKEPAVHFMKGAFFLQLKEVDDNLVAIPITSINKEEVDVVFGWFDDLDSALKSKRGRVIKFKIEKNEFDYLVINNGDNCIYYINSEKGLIKCDIELYVRDK